LLPVSCTKDFREHTVRIIENMTGQAFFPCQMPDEGPEADALHEAP
jgi:hypothetical protein